MHFDFSCLTLLLRELESSQVAGEPWASDHGYTHTHSSVTEPVLQLILNQPQLSRPLYAALGWDFSQRRAGAIRHSCPHEYSRSKARGCRLEELESRNHQMASRMQAYGCWGRLALRRGTDGATRHVGGQGTARASAKQIALHPSHHQGSQNNSSFA